jgi:hypothetical protein
VHHLIRARGASRTFRGYFNTSLPRGLEIGPASTDCSIYVALAGGSGALGKITRTACFGGGNGPQIEETVEVTECSMADTEGVLSCEEVQQ